jgi:hypothetical protein
MHFVSAMFRSHAGIDAVIALYKGGAPALVDVMSGQAHMAVATAVTSSCIFDIAGYVKAPEGKGLIDMPGAAKVHGLPSFPRMIAGS